MTEQTPPTSNPPPRKAPRWMKIAFVSSIALNLVVVGLVAGFIASGGPKDGPARMGRDRRPLRQPR